MTTAPAMITRRAELADVSRIALLGPQLFANAASLMGPVDEPALAAALTVGIRDNLLCVIMASVDDTIVGVHIASQGSAVFSGAVVVQSVTTWVSPEFRRRGAAAALLAQAEAWAREIGAVAMFAGVPDDYSAHAKRGDSGAVRGVATDFYVSRGYRQAETIMAKGI